MQEANSAGTVIAAILENAGYVSQEVILDNFTQFWASAGTFVFIVAALTALVTASLLGSYRTAAYLIVGPILFSYLVDTRREVDPVVWKLGGGRATDVAGVFNGPTEDYRPDHKPNVSTFFAFYTRGINTIVNELTDLVLKNEDNDELLFLAKSQALDALFKAQSTRSELISMLSYTVFQDCSMMMGAVMGLAGYDAGPEHLAELDEAAAVDPRFNRTRQYQQRVRSELEARLARGEAEIVKPGAAMVQFIERQTNMAIAGRGGRFYNRELGVAYPNDPERFVREELPDMNLSCGQVMDVYSDAAIAQGEWLQRYALSNILGQSYNDTPENRLMMCHVIADKLIANYVPTTDCDLGPIVMLFMMRNAITKSSLAEISQRTQNRTNLVTSTVGRDCRDRERRFGIGEEEDNGLPDYEGSDFCRTEDIEAPSTGDKEITDANELQARQLMQGIFSYALNIPYYQGLILYLLSISYPFAALLVIVPGKAKGFMFMPLAWLWVKSWDIGFALVFILDKVLWNLVPRLNMPPEGPGSLVEMSDLLRAVLGNDLSYHIHLHYHFIAVALFAVPAVTGAAIFQSVSGGASALFELTGRYSERWNERTRQRSETRDIKDDSASGFDIFKERSYSTGEAQPSIMTPAGTQPSPAAPGLTVPGQTGQNPGQPQSYIPAPRVQNPSAAANTPQQPQQPLQSSFQLGLEHRSSILPGSEEESVSLQRDWFPETSLPANTPANTVRPAAQPQAPASSARLTVREEETSASLM